MNAAELAVYIHKAVQFTQILNKRNLAGKNSADERGRARQTEIVIICRTMYILRHEYSN